MSKKQCWRTVTFYDNTSFFITNTSNREELLARDLFPCHNIIELKNKSARAGERVEITKRKFYINLPAYSKFFSSCFILYSEATIVDISILLF